MNRFNYYNPVKIYFGQNELKRISSLIGQRRVLLLTSQGFTKRGVVATMTNSISHIEFVIDSIPPNPTLKDLKYLYSLVKFDQIDVIVALGGGSVIDAAKVLSVYHDTPKFEFVEELIKTGQGEKYKLCPIIAIPTTSGTSSEITPWATVWDTDERKKYSLHLKDLWCEAAVYDPVLTVSLPIELTIHTALDALSHSLESIWNKNANCITTEHATFAAKEIINILPKLLEDLSNIGLREKLMYASLKAGLAFSNTQTSIAHAISYYLTLNNNMPHGIACSFTLPSITKVVRGQNVDIDFALGKIFNNSKYQDLNEFMKKLGSYTIDDIYQKYQVSKEDLLEIKESLSNIQRSKNSLVDQESLFKELLDSFKIG